jgi:uncharacterized protein RhaS with RHS repeats
LDYNYFRDYDPAVGRYVQADPIGQAAGSNMYGYVDEDPLKYMDPFALSKYDQVYGLSKHFWRWYHRQIKRRGDPDLTKDEAMDLHKEWQDLGKPKPDNKGKQKGEIDQDLLDWIIPWPITPGTLGCSDLDCNANGIMDDEEDEEPRECK